jgi:hypothetical protein
VQAQWYTAVWKGQTDAKGLAAQFRDHDMGQGQSSEIRFVGGFLVGYLILCALCLAVAKRPLLWRHKGLIICLAPTTRVAGWGRQ